MSLFIYLNLRNLLYLIQMTATADAAAVFALQAKYGKAPSSKAPRQQGRAFPYPFSAERLRIFRFVRMTADPEIPAAAASVIP